jgi:hypothetical protein
MPRGWHPLRFFVREDGRLHPTILFWLFLLPGLAVAVAGCYTVLNRRAEQQTAAAALTKTPTLAATQAAIPTASVTPEPPTPAPTATAYVYDDPSGWEFVEKTDPTGKKYLDLQDWQKEQVWHAFGEFWDLLYHNGNGLPDWDAVESYVTGSFADYVRGDYSHALQTGWYIYFVEGLQDVPHRAMVLESPDPSAVKVKVILGMDRSYQLQHRDVDTGAIVDEGKWLPYQTWSFIMGFRDGSWIIEQESHELFQP